MLQPKVSAPSLSERDRLRELRLLSVQLAEGEVSKAREIYRFLRGDEPDEPKA